MRYTQTPCFPHGAMLNAYHSHERRSVARHYLFSASEKGLMRSPCATLHVHITPPPASDTHDANTPCLLQPFTSAIFSPDISSPVMPHADLFYHYAVSPPRRRHERYQRYRRVLMLLPPPDETKDGFTSILMLMRPAAQRWRLPLLT